MVEKEANVMTPGNTNKIPHHQYPNSRAPATDYGLGMLPLTGRTLVISGIKADGVTPYARTISNVSFVPSPRGDHRVVGVDIGKPWVNGRPQFVTFQLAGIKTLRLRALGIDGPTFKGVDLKATMDAALKGGTIVETKVIVDEEVAA